MRCGKRAEAKERESHGNLCALGDSIEPFFGSVLNRFEDQFRAYVRNSQQVAS